MSLLHRLHFVRSPAWLLCALLSAGCGRVGIELLSYETGDAGPFGDGGTDVVDSGTDEDAGVADDGGSDGARADGASTDGASSDGASSDGASTPCEPTSTTDTTCNGVDDDCNGSIDDGYVAVGGCGVGYCQANAAASRCTSGVETACTPAAPLSSNDATLDQVDDDCDGMVDEDACTARTETFGPGMHTLAQVGCTHITVKLWGGAGSAGDSSGGYWGVSVTGGSGGAGGYAQGVLTVSATSQVQIYVGQGGRSCDVAGTNPNAAHNGGAGGVTNAEAGAAGADGTQAGGNGGTAGGLGGGGKGGNGSNGGGGGGAGNNSGYAKFGKGGAGGAATYAQVVNGASIVAGGGGGGGGAGSDFTTMGHSGANGGSGCGANGTNGDQAGGGGGGGNCRGGNDMRQGTGRTPHDPEGLLTNGSAVGGINTTDCAAGGNGYAVVTFAP